MSRNRTEPGLDGKTRGMTADEAYELAERLLAEPLPRRWAHTQGVARRALELAPAVGEDSDLIHAAALLHDVGYAPELAVTGLHPLDGARYLRGRGVDERLVRLVAHHSCALCEARERGLASELLDEFEPERGDLMDALLWCDMTTSPDGEPVDLDERLRDIFERYPPDDPVARSITAATPELRAAVHRVEQRLAATRAQRGAQPM